MNLCYASQHMFDHDLGKWENDLCYFLPYCALRMWAMLTSG